MSSSLNSNNKFCAELSLTMGGILKATFNRLI
jgi:hypothetical protein